MAARIYSESTQLRDIAEPEAAALSALNANAEQRQRILDAAHMISPEPYGIEAMIAAGFAFHSTILEGTGNIMISQLQGLILALLQFSYPTGAINAPEEKVSKLKHIGVAEAIAEGNATDARTQMRSMLEQNLDIADKLNT